MDPSFRTALVAARLAVAAALSATSFAHASDIDTLVMFRNAVHEQLDESGATYEVGSFLSFSARAANPGQFVGGEMQAPSGTGIVLSPQEPFPFAFQNFSGGSAFFAGGAGLTLLNQTYSSGSYTAQLFDSFGPGPTATMEYGDDAYVAEIPRLVGGTFHGAQNLDPTQPYTFEFNPYVGSGDEQFIFVSVYENFGAGGFVVGASFLSSSTTSWTMPAGALQHGLQYQVELIYSNRFFQDAAASGTNFGPLLSFDSRTLAVIQTAPIPEPGTWALMALGLAAVGAVARRRS